MKKRTISLFLSLAIIISLCMTPAYAATFSPEQETQIAQLEKDIAAIDKTMATYGKSYLVMGKVISSGTPYVVSGAWTGPTTSTGDQYIVIDNPQNGLDLISTYAGRHKDLGTITININGTSVTCKHFGSMSDKWYALLKERTAKQTQIDKIKASPALLSSSDLRAYAGGALNRIVMQVGNQYLTVYGMDKKFTDATPAIVNGSTLLPIRAIIENSYGTVEWDASTGTVNIWLGGTDIQLKSNSTSAIVNGNTVAMETPAQIINSRLMVPVRFVVENLGMKVDWVSFDKVIIITNPNYESSVFAERLTLSGEYYTYSDYTNLEHSYLYPATWGNPTILRSNCGNGIYTDNIKLIMPYAYLKINCELYPSADLINKVRTPGANYETVPLTDKNSHIEAIVKTTDAYAEINNYGEILILTKYGRVFTLGWMLNNMDSGLDQTISDVLYVANSFSESEAVG